MAHSNLDRIEFIQPFACKQRQRGNVHKKEKSEKGEGSIRTAFPFFGITPAAVGQAWHSTDRVSARSGCGLWQRLQHRSGPLFAGLLGKGDEIHSAEIVEASRRLDIERTGKS